MFKNKSFVEIQNSITKSQSKTYNEFISIYLKAHTVKDYNKRMLTNKKDCPCLDVIRSYGYPELYSHRSSLRNGIDEAIYTNKLEEKFTQEDCLNFRFKYNDFSYKIIGIEKASEYFFHKKTSQLNQSEKINLVLMLDNSALYNPLRNGTYVKKKIEYYKKLISEQP